MLKLKDLVEWANSEEGQKYLDHNLYVQMPIGSSCMSYDIDNVEQIGVRDNSLVLIPDYCLYTNETWYSEGKFEHGTYPVIFDIDDDYYKEKAILKRQLVEGE